MRKKRTTKTQVEHYKIVVSKMVKINANVHVDSVANKKKKTVCFLCMMYIEMRTFFFLLYAFGIV